jgi:16S rRNA (cytosine1402-N4)-methyltransferase
MTMAELEHVPILLEEVVAILAPAPGKTIVDATIGLGGHAAELARRGARIVGVDLDPGHVERARRRLEETGGDFVVRHGNFAGLPGILAELGIEAVDGILADLGVAGPHLDDPARGFSYRRPGPLDMRLDPTRGKPAMALLQEISEEDLARALRELGDEEEAERIARMIVERRPVRTTRELAEIVCEARGFSPRRAAGAKLHPAARTFQAIRMLVNRELPNLERLLDVLPRLLRPGGVAAILTFHSGEDRRVKRAFRDGLRAGIYDRGSDEPVRPGLEEQARNPRSRSAKLRWVRRAAAGKEEPS